MLPVPGVGLIMAVVKTGEVTLLFDGATTLLAKKSELGACWQAAERGFDGGLCADGVGSSGIVGIGCGAR